MFYNKMFIHSISGGSSLLSASEVFASAFFSKASSLSSLNLCSRSSDNSFSYFLCVLVSTFLNSLVIIESERDPEPLVGLPTEEGELGSQVTGELAGDDMPKLCLLEFSLLLAFSSSLFSCSNSCNFFSVLLKFEWLFNNLSCNSLLVRVSFSISCTYSARSFSNCLVKKLCASCKSLNAVSSSSNFLEESSS
ncbi:hypothetical protein R103_E20251 [Saccharomyces cerevisiae R103]|uniref:Putative uncharacterized membrane protein YER148W-A n=3 Tax=Saccharomyces cerevisiae TaxID=4932 RepID=YE148_YEAST|nr:RecName: Full=Putative uncharacterized membrane protein YER148W-A [Saccharomyces cerevisiae S288C]pir/S53555/ probable membrane protein YER148w-a - yeast (Saccharomyces cerevisiae) [Saccharomyces cerevisiae]EWG86646.1 hypothetical protein R008_E11806 [Saccharomyces cerevisiae R008]EWG96301.1 hypothetical protein R103_E20251 [Saccharomyces cerevisiae R103]WNV72588.1 hypothetical protein O6U65_0904 [Saccharomyces cerevisiae synthetic construct]CAY79337.1 EC1118_1E8_2927p [Saccharomyces cerevi